MTTVQLLESLKTLAEECGKDEPTIDMNDVAIMLAKNSKEYSDALAKAIRALS